MCVCVFFFQSSFQRYVLYIEGQPSLPSSLARKDLVLRDACLRDLNLQQAVVRLQLSLFVQPLHITTEIIAN